MALEELEKKEILDKVKSDLMKETKEDVEKIIKLIHDERQKYEDMLKQRISETDFKAYQEKSHSVEQELKKKIDELEINLKASALSAAQHAKSKERGPEDKAYEKFIRQGAVSAEEQKFMRISEDPVGGYVAPPIFSNRLIELITEISPVRQIASVETIGASGVQFPKEDEDAVTVAWDDEELVAGQYKFGLESFNPQNVRALVTAHRNLLQDAVFNIESYIQRKAAIKYAKKEGAAFISGNSVKKPEGLLFNKKVQTVASGDASSITSDSLLKLVYEVPEAYARNGGFLMKRKTVLAIRLLKDQENRYIWQPGLQAGQPSTLLGYPVYEAPDMPEVASGAEPIIFGDTRTAYLIIDRQEIAMQRLVEVYATQGLIGFLFWKRVDAHVVVPEAIRKLVISAS